MRNNFEIKDDIVLIDLFIRKENKIIKCIIDKDKFDFVNSYDLTWCPKWSYEAKRFYVGASQYFGLFNGKAKRKMIYLHRILLDCKNFGEWVDHIDHDGMNNRVNNLRIVTSSQNAKYREKINSNNNSGYRNVCFYKGWYLVQIQVDGKNKMLGKFKNIDDAGKFAEEMRLKYYGEFAGNNK